VSTFILILTTLVCFDAVWQFGFLMLEPKLEVVFDKFVEDSRLTFRLGIKLLKHVPELELFGLESIALLLVIFCEFQKGLFVSL
jgi:hypothetical protein